MEWQDLWEIKSAGTISKETEEVVMGVLISRRTSIMKKAPKEELSSCDFFGLLRLCLVAGLGKS